MNVTDAPEFRCFTDEAITELESRTTILWRIPMEQLVRKALVEIMIQQNNPSSVVSLEHHAVMFTIKYRTF